MLHTKTHYDQIPVEEVLTIVEEQLRRSSAIEQDEEIENKKQEDSLLDNQAQIVAGSSSFPGRRPQKS
jgi:C4-type Zn-finger protein